MLWIATRGEASTLQSPEHEFSESGQEKFSSELQTQYYKKDWKYTSDVRKNMQKHGLYNTYTRNVESAKEARKMAYVIDLMSK